MLFPIIGTTLLVRHQRLDRLAVVSHIGPSGTYDVTLCSTSLAERHHSMNIILNAHGSIPRMRATVTIWWLPWLDRFVWTNYLYPYLAVHEAHREHLDGDAAKPWGDAESACVWAESEPMQLLPGESPYTRACAIALAYWKRTATRPSITVAFNAWVANERVDTIEYTFDGADAQHFADYGYL